MGKPITEGRMIRKSISDSPDFMLLTPEAAVLFCMIIPHLNSHGKLQGGPAFIKEIVCPKIPYLTLKNIPVLLKEISNKTDMKWFEYDSRYWIHAIHFNEHQKLNQNKIGQDLLPTYSELSPDVVTYKDKDKEEVKEEVEGDKSPLPRKSFLKPTIEEIIAYCRERNNTVSAQVFINHYESNGWMVGKNKMKDWKAAVRTWETRGDGNGNGNKREGTTGMVTVQKEYVPEPYERPSDEQIKRNIERVHEIVEKIAG
jgi:hypothetical protein